MKNRLGFLLGGIGIGWLSWLACCPSVCHASASADSITQKDAIPEETNANDTVTFHVNDSHVNEKEPQTTTQSKLTVTNSGRVVVALRAIDSQDANNQFSDPLAHILAGPEYLARTTKLLNTVANNTPTQKSRPRNQVQQVVCRTMMVDELLFRAIRDNKFHAPKQVVILGSGMDTRGFRMAYPGIKWWEVDFEQVVSLKEHLLSDAGVDPTNGGSIKRIKLDLKHGIDRLVPLLKETGFDANAPAVFVLEGVVYYMDKADVATLLGAIPCVPTSHLLVTVLDKGSIEELDSFRTLKRKDKLGRSDKEIKAWADQMKTLWKTHIGDINNILNRNQNKVWAKQTLVKVGGRQASRMFGLDLSVASKIATEFIVDFRAK